MSYDLFYVYLMCGLFFMIITVGCSFLAYHSFKHGKHRNPYKPLLDFLFIFIASVYFGFFWFIPSVKDYFNIRHNKYAIIEGNAVLIKNLWKPSKYYVRINNINIKLDQYDYESMISNTNYKITYLPNSKIAIKIEKR